MTRRGGLEEGVSPTPIQFLCLFVAGDLCVPMEVHPSFLPSPPPFMPPSSLSSNFWESVVSNKAAAGGSILHVGPIRARVVGFRSKSGVTASKGREGSFV